MVKWSQKSPSSYQTALRDGLLTELFPERVKHKTGKHDKRKIFWTKERLYEDAKNYKSRKDWRKYYSSAYATAWRNKLLDEIFPRAKSADIKIEIC